uniref:Uncharacterized protein n=1 Tax=Leersia perrieri TaxID=77586 RepID=A0A0D9W322_9ORYZ
MANLATALELTGRPFIWAIRPPPESDMTNTNAAEWLPEGFEERVRGKNTGLLIHGWAPQVSILAHASTGAFMSYCGWNSVLESVAHGVPMVAWPLSAEQFLNAKMVEEEWGACVEVSRGNALYSPAVEPDRVADAVEKAMGRTAEAREMRRGLIGRAELEDGGSSVLTALQKLSSFTLHDRTGAKKCGHQEIYLRPFRLSPCHRARLACTSLPPPALGACHCASSRTQGLNGSTCAVAVTLASVGLTLPHAAAARGSPPDLFNSVEATRYSTQPRMAAKASKSVVLFPFPGQGHLAAFMSFAGVFHRAVPDVAIILVSTPGNVASLRRAASASDSSSSFLAFHALPFAPADHGLPPGCESADGIPSSRIMDLLEAFETLQPAFDDFLAGVTGVVCIVSDPFVAWTVTVARRRGCAHAFFASCGAFGSAILHSLFSRLPVRPDAATGRVYLPEYPEVVIDRSQVAAVALRQVAAGEIDRTAAFYGRQIPLGYKTDAVLVNTVEEFEPTGLTMLRQTFKLPILPIGPLGAPRRRRTPPPPPSPVFSTPTRHQHMVVLAAALEATRRPFVWAIKPPDGHDMKRGEIRPEWLPEGFEEGVTAATKKGLLVHGWAPQVRILAHPSTGAFLSHCGWNSVLESVAHEVPIIEWPLAGEQFYNAKMLDEEWGVCVEVARGNAEDTIVEKGTVVAVVDTVMGPTAKATKMRRRVSEIKQIMEAAREDGDGSSRKKALELFKAMQQR